MHNHVNIFTTNEYMTASNHETARLEAHLEHVRDDIGEMKVVISDMAKAIRTLTSIEAKQEEHNGAISRCFTEIGEVRARVTSLEIQQPLAKQTQGVVNKAVEVILVAVLGALIALVVVKPAEVKAQPAVIQASPASKGVEVQTHGAAK